MRRTRLLSLLPLPLLATLAVAPACTAASGDDSPSQATAAEETPPLANARPLPVTQMLPRMAVPGAPQSAAPVAAPVDTGPPPAQIDESGYTLAATAPPAPAKKGTPTTVTLALTPKSGFHVNLDAPLELTLTTPANVKAAKSDLHKADAASASKSGARFDVPLTLTAPGPAIVTATLKFVVCDDAGTTCIPAKKSVAWHLSAT